MMYTMEANAHLPNYREICLARLGNKLTVCLYRLEPQMNTGGSQKSTMQLQTGRIR